MISLRTSAEAMAVLARGTAARHGPVPRELARGIMPETQRLETRHGRHGADWHLKLGLRRRELLAEVEQLAQNERLSAMIDFPKIRPALDDLPATGAIPVKERLLREGAIPRAIMLARYVNYFEGRNK